MHLRAKLTKTDAADQPVFSAALQSNEVYLPSLSLPPPTGIAARQINVIR